MSKKRILFVAMQQSQHTIHWVKQLHKLDCEPHFYSINSLPIKSEIKGVTFHWSLHTRILRRLEGLFRQLGSAGTPVARLLDKVCLLVDQKCTTTLADADTIVPYFYGPKQLAKTIKKIRPHPVHSLEFQHCGYLTLSAKDILGDEFPLWWVTNLGSDIYHFRNFDSHRKAIIRLLSNVDFYSCECHRDSILAKELGFKGIEFPVNPNTGGFNLQTITTNRSSITPSKRKLILVKGYQSFAGRAITALDAPEACAEELNGYKILLYSASTETRIRIEELLISKNLDISILDYTGHDVMFQMFSRTRVYLGVSISDGISTSMLEAMALGAFPIQTETSCCNEWISDGKTGFTIPHHDILAIADRIKRAVSNDNLFDVAA